METDEYLLELSRYIHRNPLDVLASTPGVELADYRWSSYPRYLTRTEGKLIDPTFILNYFSKAEPAKDYKKFVEYDFTDKDLSKIEYLIFDEMRFSLRPLGLSGI